MRTSDVHGWMVLLVASVLAAAAHAGGAGSVRDVTQEGADGLAVSDQRDAEQPVELRQPGQDPPRRQETGSPPMFEEDVLPILARKCHDCHGASAQEAQLDLRTVSSILQGGENGPAVVSGDPVASLMVDLVSQGQMPPDGSEGLSAAESETIRQWVIAGIPAKQSVAPVSPRSHVSVDDRKFWAFEPPRKRPLPTVKGVDQVRTVVDVFLLAKLEPEQLTFAPEADRLTLIRRAYFDLIGLPPEPYAVRAFLADPRPDAYERLIDLLLSSPHYGQRWGRHWLDAAGYVDNRLYDGDLSLIYPNEGIWRFRDYVIHGFNEDKPFDRFLAEQLAGDELVDWRGAASLTPEMMTLLSATGFLRCVEDPTSEPEYGIEKRYDVIHQVMDMLSTSVLGLTMECCRCHNHKYDPLSQRDYYRLMACFEPAFNVHDWKRPQERFVADVPLAQRADIDAHNAAIDARIADLKASVKAAEKGPAELQVAELKRQIRDIEGQKKSYGKVQCLWDVGPAPTSRVLRRGNVHAPGVCVQPGFPEVLQPVGVSAPTSVDGVAGASSGRRLALARWLASPDHPLTGRVLVNRVWHHHFGRGIVETLGNFGRSGSLPTHPELLDWLTVDLIEHGWSLKRLHRHLVLSSAYRQSSRRVPTATDDDSVLARGEQVDPDNRLLWRMNLRRLEAEIVRDSILAISNSLDRAAGGPPDDITTPQDGASETASRRRSVYLFARRVYPLKILELFDAPIMPVNCTQRTSSATVLQSLAQLNSALLFDQADRMAARIIAAAGSDPAAQIDLAFELALGRNPKEHERIRSLDFVNEQTRHHGAVTGGAQPACQMALADLCHMVLVCNEFLYVE